MNDLDKELTEIIADLMLRTGKLKAEDNPKIFKQGLQYIKAHDEAKAKIQALILQARIKQLKDLLNNDGTCVCQLADQKVCDHNWSLCNEIKECIAQLQEENK